MCGDGGKRHGGAPSCDLCGAEAAVYCAADAAFLCAACDAKVHGANFLASRHLRSRVAGRVGEEACDDDSATSSASSSACVSAATTSRTRTKMLPRGMRRRTTKSRARGELVLEGWAKRMGLAARAARRAAAAAGRALREVPAARVPLRVAMASALWYEVAANGAGQADTLQRLEACAHVPARLVVAVASSMGSARATSRAAVRSEEGWDECS